jgi:aminopeptidase N
MSFTFMRIFILVFIISGTLACGSPFALNKVGQIIGNDTVLLKYSYDSSKITITLNKILTKGEVANIFIDYIAHPNRITEKGSQAISDSKGLYFINPLKQVPNKPRQIWTQGEPECNSD